MPQKTKPHKSMNILLAINAREVLETVSKVRGVSMTKLIEDAIILQYSAEAAAFKAQQHD